MFDREGRGFSDVSENIFRAGLRRHACSTVGHHPGHVRHRAAARRRLHPERHRLRGRTRAARSPACATTTRPTAIARGRRSSSASTRCRWSASSCSSRRPRTTFLADESIPAGREQFGLLSQDVNASSAASTISPNDTVHFGLSYGRDEFGALQKSRNANPPPDPTWTDPAPQLDARQQRGRQHVDDLRRPHRAGAARRPTCASATR